MGQKYIQETFDTNWVVPLGSKEISLIKTPTKTPVSDNAGYLHNCCPYKGLQ